jgi:hypothetical protein
MHAPTYKKMAGTAAVFLSSEFDKASPVERDGMVWTAQELHLDKLPKEHHRKPMMQTVLALEGLEEYDKPEDGDIRRVDSVGSDFVYFQRISGWVQQN